MLENLLQFSIRHRWFVLLATLGVAALGVVNFQRLPIDAVPDITNVQVQINTEAPGFSPLEAEQRAGRARLWDRAQDRDASAEWSDANVPQQPYVYQTK